MTVSLENNPTTKSQASIGSADVTSKLTVQQHSPDEATLVMSLWKELDERLDTNSMATSSIWIETWLNHYGDLVPHRFLVAKQNGTTRGICLLTNGVDHRIGPFHFNGLHIGTAGEPESESVCVEYNRLLVEDQFRSEFVRELLKIVEQDSDWDQFDLDGFSKDEVEQFSNRLPELEIRTEQCRYFNLKQARADATDVISNLGKSTRANIRRQIRKFGDLQVEWAESLVQGESIFSELIELHQKRWIAEGKPGAFASSRFEQFQTELMARLLPLDKVILFRVRQADETVGCLLLLVDQNRLLDYISGFASFEKQFSPGLVTHYLCMEEALRRGYDAYDFLVGERRHKQNLSTDSTELIWASWKRPRFKYRLVNAIRSLRKQLRRFQGTQRGWSVTTKKPSQQSYKMRARGAQPTTKDQNHE